MKSEKVKSPFTPAEHKRIDAAMAAIEHDTSADLCVVVTRASDRYALYPVAWAAIAAIALGALVESAPARDREPHRDRDPTVVPDCDDAAARLASDPAPARTEARQARSRLATRASRIQRACDRNAEQQHRILLFVSLGERYVEIVADHETHALAPAGAWNKIVDEFLINRESRPRRRRRPRCGRGLRLYPEDTPSRIERIVGEPSSARSPVGPGSLLTRAHTPALMPQLCNTRGAFQPRAQQLDRSIFQGDKSWLG